MERIPINILGVGHPRTGTKYTAKLLQSWGLDVGHEEWKKDGIVAWQALIPQAEGRIKQSNRLPYMTQNLKLELIQPKVIIHTLRDPRTAIPSITKTEIGSLEWRSLWTPFTSQNSSIENTILSIVYTDLRIEGFFPERFSYKIETEAEKLHQHLETLFDLKPQETAPSKQTNKKRDYDKSVDWDSVRPRFRELINQYSLKYGYEPIF